MTRVRPPLIRILLLLLSIGAVVLVAYVTRASRPHPIAHAQVPVQCKQDIDAAEALTSRYLFHPDYGWFDSTHFFAGNPGKVIDDVRRAARAGGGIVVIEQKLHDGAAGYIATYNISRGIQRQNELAVALGVYQDWSYRFEGWQGRLPQRAAAMLSSYAVEDLPSHYIGFFAEARDLQIHEVFACYMPQTMQTEESPPRFSSSQAIAADTEAFLNHPQRLTNEKMRPMIRDKDGWHNVSWPPDMQLETIDSSTGLWSYLAEEDWYFDGEERDDLLVQHITPTPVTSGQ